MFDVSYMQLHNLLATCIINPAPTLTKRNLHVVDVIDVGEVISVVNDVDGAICCYQLYRKTIKR